MVPEGPVELSDRELMEAVQRDEPDAFERFVHRFQRRFYRIAMRYLRDHEMALDAVQEAFLKIHQARSKWEPRAQPYTWAYRIVANHCIDLLRRQGRMGEDSLDDDDSHLARALSDPKAEDPEEVARTHETGAALRRALGRLPAAQREILVLRHFEDLSLLEIAELKGWPLGTVKSSLHRATKSLKEILVRTEDEFHEPL